MFISFFIFNFLFVYVLNDINSVNVDLYIGLIDSITSNFEEKLFQM